MILVIDRELLDRIHRHGEDAYPEEGAGFLLGTIGEARAVEELFPLPNAREVGARHNRYMIEPREYMRAEVTALARSMDVIGVFHSHPDHPDRPSEYDREWAQPNFSYLITRVDSGRAMSSKSWRLAEDRRQFLQEEFRIE